MKIAVGSDHHGFHMKEQVKEHLVALGHEVDDHGCTSADEVDYPDIAVSVAEGVAAGTSERAVLICGTGLGMAIAACKVPGVRAAPVSDPYSAERLQKSNNAQVLCLGAKVVGPEVATMLVDHWLNSEFQGGDSARKVAKIDALDERERTLEMR
jgi:ribose 5-phosphate isomerase B